DAIPLDLMKREQRSISKQLVAIEHEIDVRSTTFDEILKNLSLAFDLIEDCGNTYRKANDTVKRLMNQAIFNKIWIHNDGTVTADLNVLYKHLIGPVERELVDMNKNQRPPKRTLILSRSYSNPTQIFLDKV
ncbi:MAG: hypothetical protein K5837_04025, partial [Candidatus Saccharibacteria bacterium]|nr:hypothetical protein [Candidatus Saccharibacteria bacterium]